ncbi:CBS domain-containing protein [bacterium]|nr:CBS domain-containing protein [bacterium]
MKVERWMTSPAITVTPDVPVSLALRKMMEHEIRRLPVVDEDGDLVGLVTDRDLRQALPPHEIPRASGEYRPAADEPTVEEWMLRGVAVVAPEDNLREAIEVMHDQRITGLPVVRGRKCVGVITVQDLMEVLLVALQRHAAEIDRETTPAAPDGDAR